MELFVFRPPEYDLLYNCSFYDVDSVSLAQRRDIPLGVAFLTLGIVEWLMYVPCMAAIWKHSHITCYKIMFFLGILDMLCIPIAGICTGILGILGAVYCSAPNLIYVAGCCALSLWCTESSIEILLAINRCIEICSPRLGALLFRGGRVWLWIAPLVLYGQYVFWCWKPTVWSGIYFSWFFNAHIGYDDDAAFAAQYLNPLHPLHDWGVAVLLTGAYIFFVAILVIKSNRMWTNADGTTTSSYAQSQKMIFVQVALISSVHAINAVIYIYMQYGSTPEILILIAQFLWFQSHGIPPLIYLAMNKTLRHESIDIIRALCGRKRQPEVWATSTALSRHTRSLAFTRSS